MALVVLLRGVNVGGHRTFRPTQLVERLRPLDVVNLGAAGTFVVRSRIARTALRAAFARELPFVTTIVLCSGAEVLRLTSRDPFAGRRIPGDAMRFASVLARRSRATPSLPVRLPARGPRELELFERADRFVLGWHRRIMGAIDLLGEIDARFGVPATTRGWNTWCAIARILRGENA